MALVHNHLHRSRLCTAITEEQSAAMVFILEIWSRLILWPLQRSFVSLFFIFILPSLGLMFVMLRHVWNYQWTLCFPVTCFAPHLTFSFNLFSYFLMQNVASAPFFVFKSIASETGSWIQRDNTQTVILTFCSGTGNGLCFIDMAHLVWYVWCSNRNGLLSLFLPWKIKISFIGHTRL